jgi:hypothetical protein
MQQKWGKRGMRIGLWWESLRGKRPLGRPRWKWEDIRIDLGEVGWGCVDWIGLAQIGTSGELL